MAAVVITPNDLVPFATIAEAKAQAMIDDALAMASRVAPCILDDDFGFAGAAKAVIRRAVLRWDEAGSGAATTIQQNAGPFGQMQVTDNRSTGGRLFWPSEIEQLQALCQTDATGAFSVDTAPGLDGLHQPWCAVSFGATYCSCGVDIAGYPIFEA